MGIFSNLFRKKPTIELRDSVFGPISYDRGVWTFVPKEPKEGFMINVIAAAAGPSELQRVVFSRVRSELAEYERRARDYMTPHLDESVSVSQLSIYAVLIGDDDESQREELVLEFSDRDAFTVHRVSFRKGEPVDYGADD